MLKSKEYKQHKKYAQHKHDAIGKGAKIVYNLNCSINKSYKSLLQDCKEIYH